MLIIKGKTRLYLKPLLVYQDVFIFNFFNQGDDILDRVCFQILTEFI